MHNFIVGNVNSSVTIAAVKLCTDGLDVSLYVDLCEICGHYSGVS